MKYLILSAILAALLCLSQSSAQTRTGTQERVNVCPGINPWGVRVVLRSGAVRVYCADGIYTEAEVGTGRAWDDGK